ADYQHVAVVFGGGAQQGDAANVDFLNHVGLGRAAAKNYRDVLVVSSREQYEAVTQLLDETNGAPSLEDRRHYAALAFATTSHYDTEIQKYVRKGTILDGSWSRVGAAVSYENSEGTAVPTPLRYGENPHQASTFYGNLNALFDQLHGKQLSYNNLVDVDAAVQLMREFAEGQPAVAILKHTNACGVAQADTLHTAYVNALACDPVSAFGGVIIVNKEVDLATAQELHKLFFEVLIAPSFAADALPVLQGKKNRILLRQKPVAFPKKQIKTLLNGIIEQDADLQTESAADFRPVTKSAPTDEETEALVFAGKICKHTKSNTIVLARPGQLLASGVGQT
ncbi:MAG: bifunctional phosphoribosylaminoimidazolecarboxamide formyltransferase/IMP cyclohydrolase PurH, partial [Hymenobacter sp.]